jgi:hypothetical protein
MKVVWIVFSVACGWAAIIEPYSQSKKVTDQTRTKRDEFLSVREISI